MAWHYVGARDADAPLPVRLLGVWRHRRLLKRMAERELRQRYVGSALGLAWTALSPLIFVAVYVVIFTFVFGARLNPGAPTAEYALYVLAGLLPWVAFSEVAGRSTQTMAEHRNLVKFVVFPVQILPLTSLYVVALSQAIGLLVLVLLATWLHGGPPPGLWLLPAVLVLQAIFLAGVAWLLGALGAVLRDVKEVVQVALMVGMFLTPIFYLERDLPRPLRLIVRAESAGPPGPPLPRRPARRRDRARAEPAGVRRVRRRHAAGRIPDLRAHPRLPERHPLTG